MLLRGSNNRGARGSNRSRGSSRGRGSTSRGVPSSSSTSSNSSSPNPFDKERLENAAKREQKGLGGTAQTERRGSQGSIKKQDIGTTAQHNGTNRPSSPAIPNPFAGKATSATNPFGTPTPASSNPFGPNNSSTPASVFSISNGGNATNNTFGAPSGQASVFGAPSQQSSVFGASSTSAPSNAFSNPFGKPSTSTFGGSSRSSSPNPFAVSASKMNGNTEDPSHTKTHSTVSKPNPFGSPSNTGFSSAPTSINSSVSNTSVFSRPTFGASHTPAVPSFPSNTSNGTRTSSTNGAIQKPRMPKFTPTSIPEDKSTNTPGTALAQRLDQHLRKQGISPPKWPMQNPGDPKQKDAVKTFWQIPLKGYRSKVRASLIQAGFLDDPEKPKRLSEAIDFKGTCEEMCPEFEKFTRIVDHSVDGHEKDRQADGSMWPSMQKMVKALARSAAGQDAPLPMDVRTPAALRRTLDYLLHTILGNDESLPKVHGFLWDRTRAIRRDFVFQQSAMGSSEMSDQIYCLERITRFHVIALHNMSRDDFTSEDFTEQQEVEQLGKALLSLIHAYEDCNSQKIKCENEAEFRAYYVLFNSHNTAILEHVQDWGWNCWENSQVIQTAVSLVEALQNIWDVRGPLKPYQATDIGLNAFSKFFSILEDPDVSYTMACFAEIHFNSVRKAIFKTILTAYRKQRDQTKEWTLSKLNAYLRFDNEDDIVAFGEAYGLRFEEGEEEEYLSFDSADSITDPFPPLKQPHSYCLVERKRGDYTLPQAIDVTVFEEMQAGDKEFTDSGELPAQEAQQDEEEGLFVKEDTPNPTNQGKPDVFSTEHVANQAVTDEQTAKLPTTNQQDPTQPSKAKSIFDRITPPSSKQTPFGDIFQQPQSAVPQIPMSSSGPSIFSAPKTSDGPSIFTQNSPSATPTPKLPTFSWSQPTATDGPPPSNSNSTNPTTVPPTSAVSIFSKPVNEPTVQFQQPTTLSGHAVTNPPVSSAGNGVGGTSQAPTSTWQTPLHPQTPVLGVTPPTQPEIPSAQTSIPHFIPTAPTEQASGQSLNSITAPSTSTALTVTNVQEDRDQKFARFSDWFIHGQGGLLEQFTEGYVAKLLMDTMEIYVEEEKARQAKEAAELARRRQEQERYQYLATKYLNLWRHNAQLQWQRRTGKATREAFVRMAEEARAAKAASSASLVDDFKASTRRRRRDSLESLLTAGDVNNGAKEVDVQTQATPKNTKKPKHRKSNGISPEERKRRMTQNALSRSLFSDSSYLNGEPRIHLLPNLDIKRESRPKSGVQTDYFRLKARGITTLPDGSVLANSAAKDFLHRKNSFDGVPKTRTPKPATPVSFARSVPADQSEPAGRPRTSTERMEEIKNLKSKAKEVFVEEEQKSRKRHSVDIDDDEELFARAKRIREQMDEGSSWFRKQLERDAASRSVS